MRVFSTPPQNQQEEGTQWGVSPKPVKQQNKSAFSKFYFSMKFDFKLGI